jgi:hypothetical protein
MKKNFIFSFLFILFVSAVNAQLTDTKWKNFMNIPESTESFMHFKKDTVLLSVAADGTLVETMTYTINKDTLRLTKISGMSPCGDNVIGLYRIEIKDDKLTIIPISDDCSDRANAFKPEAWTREKI